MSTAPIFTEEAFAMPTYAHGAVILNLGLALSQHDPAHRLGRAFGPQTTYPMVGEPPPREPDLTWVRAAHIPADLNVDPDAPPDLAVEVISRQVVWIVDPWMRTVTVYEPGGRIETITEQGILTGEPLIPGFAIAVAKLFD
jgi:Uma2 family endonuclease